MALTFTIVLIGWLISLCLHEFSHALVAYFGGDHTVREKGYLTNPLKYIHPITSIAIPLAILAMGGIPLPGGAVYIESWRLRSAKWESAVSLAGPASNVLVALILTIILQFAPDASLLTDLPHDSIWPGLAYLAFLQIVTVLLNMLPFPPFDGYGALRPHLHIDVRSKIEFLGPYSIWVFFFIFMYVQPVSAALFRIAVNIATFIHMPMDWVYFGSRLFVFWKL